MICVKPNPDAIFGWGFHPKMDPLLRVEADPKTIFEKESLKNHQLRVYKMAKSVLRPAKFHSRIQKRCCKRWPHSDYFLIHVCFDFFGEHSVCKSCRRARHYELVHGGSGLWQVLAWAGGGEDGDGRFRVEPP